MQGKLITIVYTQRTYWNQFSLGGICKQKCMHLQCLSNIQGAKKHLILIILIIHIIVSFDQNISWIVLWIWIPCQAVTSVLCLLCRQKTGYCSKKNAYTSEITFLALVPCPLLSKSLVIVIGMERGGGNNLNSIKFFLTFSYKALLISSGDKILQFLRIS